MFKMADLEDKNTFVRQILDQLELYYRATEELIGAVRAGNEEEIEKALDARSEACRRLQSLYFWQIKKEAAVPKEGEHTFDLPAGWLSNLLSAVEEKIRRQGEECYRKIMVLEEEIRVTITGRQLQLQKKLEEVRERQSFLRGYRAGIKQVNELSLSAAENGQETRKKALRADKNSADKNSIDKYF